MKRKFFTSLLLAAISAATWAQTQDIKVSTDVENPEHLFTLTNAGNLTMTPYTSPTQTAANAGHFAFFAVDGEENQYKIYCVDNQKWISYEKASGYSNSVNFAKLIDAQAEANPWYAAKATRSNVDYYQFAPLNTTTVASKYMNWYQGTGSNPLDNTTITVGLWQDNASKDAGSAWTITEVIIVTNTYTLNLPDGVSVVINGQSYTNGDQVTVNGTLTATDITAPEQDGKFSTIEVDNETYTVKVVYYDMPALEDSEPYTNAWLYPMQQDNVGTASLTEQDGVYTLSNKVLSASFIKTDKAIYFLGSKAMNLVAGTEPFSVSFGSGDNVAASSMTLTNVETEELTANPNAIGGAEHFAGKAIKANYTYTYNGTTINIVWRAVLRDGSHYLRTEMELTGVDDVDMYNIIPLCYKVDAKAAGSTPKTVGDTRGKVILSDKIFAGLETPTAYNTVGGEDDSDKYNLVATPVTDNVAAADWTAITENIPARIFEVAGSDKSYMIYTKSLTGLKANQKVVVTLTYKSGAKKFDIDGVDLLDGSGKVAASDYHHGYTGTAKENNTYTFSVPNNGDFDVRMFIDKREGDIVSTAEFKVEVYEPKPGAVITTDIVNIQGLWSRNTTLKAGETWKVGAVVGLVAQDGKQSEENIRHTQKRRSFLAYSERERAVPWRPNPCYISWYELNINRNNAAPGSEPSNMTASQVLDVLSQWKTQLWDKYGTAPANFVIDDGWDTYGEWNFHAGFPNQMRDIAAAAWEMGEAGVGAWLGPVGGYGQSGNYRRNYWKDKGGMQLSNQRYYEAFLKAAKNLVENQKTEGKGSYNFFKFDGISAQFSAKGPDNGDTGNENAEGIIRLEQYVRENLKEDIFFNTTVGTWASPFWYQITDATWRQENDHGEAGNNSNTRENWITYRDRLVYQNYVTNSPICPINTLMTHGFILTKFGPPASNPRDYKSVLNELRCAFACGSGLVELYNDYDLMNSIEDGRLWADLADLIKWQKDNADVLMDAHWVGGNPWTGSKCEIYGWAAWNGTKASLTLRNGGNDAQTIEITLREALEIPGNINGSIILTKCFADQANLEGLTEGEPINIDTKLTLTLPGSSVYMFGGRDSQAPVVEVQSITLDQTSYEVVQGGSIQIKATVAPADATDKTLTWTSSDEEIATVVNGVVTGKKEGTVTITASHGDITATAQVTVKIVAVESITFAESAYTVGEARTITLTPTINPSNATDKALTWTSADETIATVSEAGVVRGIKAGETTVTATAPNGKSASVTITVTENSYSINFPDDQQPTRTDRKLNSVTVAIEGQDDKVLSIDGTLVYNDLTEGETNIINCNVGDPITATFSYQGNWMNGYVYIDLNNDRQFSFREGDTNQEGTDLVSFSFYSGDFSDDSNGVNSLGEALTGGARNVLNPPSFTAPSEAGRYRIRFKVDWNSVDAGGQLAADGTPTGSNGILANGGFIVDATLNVSSTRDPDDPDTSVNAINGTSTTEILYDLSGRKSTAKRGVFITENGKKVIK